MRHRPPILRLLAALVLALGLLGSFVTPSLAQDDGTPVAEEPTTEEVTSADTDEPAETEPPAEESTDEVQAADDPVGTLVLHYYLCVGDGGTGLDFTAGTPGGGEPTQPDDDCALASSLDGTDWTFYVYLFGDTTTVPIEVTTLDGVGTNETLPVTGGIPHLITDKPIEEPEVIESGEEAEEPAVEATFAIAEGATTDIDAIQYQTGSVEIYKFLCEGDPAESLINVLDPGVELDPTQYEDCTPDDRSFTITPFDDEATYGTIPVTTEDGTKKIEEIATTDLESGPKHKITEDGTDLVEYFDVEPNETTVIVAVNNYEQATGDLLLAKVTCPGDNETVWYINEVPPVEADLDSECASADETFSIYLFGDKESTAIPVNTGEEGIIEVNDLPVTTDADPHIIVEDSTGSEKAFDILEDEVTLVTAINYEPVPVEDGTVEIEKLACSGIDEAVILVGDPGDDAANIPDNCSGDSAFFLIYPYGDEENEPIQLDVDEFDSVELPATEGTPHLLMELDGAGVPVASEYFEIQGGNFTPIQVRNPTYGSITIYSFICEGTEDSTFDVFNPGEAVTLPSDCEYLERNFDITVFGEDSSQAGSTTTVATGTDGIAGLSGIPATNNVGHVISKTSGVSAVFSVEQGLDTVIISISWQADGGVVDDTEDSENVGEIADTGTGPLMRTENGTALLFGFMSIASVVGLAAIARRRVA